MPDEAVLNHCPYVDQRSGYECPRSKRSMADWRTTRHWTSVHLLKEAKEILEGNRKIGEATLVTSKSALNEAKERLYRCKACQRYFCRGDSMRRHTVGCTKPEAKKRKGKRKV